MSQPLLHIAITTLAAVIGMGVLSACSAPQRTDELPAGVCRSDAECADAETCREGRCTSCKCQDDTECPDGARCEACVCVAPSPQETQEPREDQDVSDALADGGGEEPEAIEADATAMAVEAPPCPPWETRDLDGAGDDRQVLINGVMAAEARTDRVAIWTRTEGPERVRVRYAAGPACEEQVTRWVAVREDRDFTAEIQLTELRPGTWYRYVVEARKADRASRPAWFKTAPTRDVAVRFEFGGDISQRPKLYGLIDDAAETGAELYISVGDWPFTDTMGVEKFSREEYRHEHHLARSHPSVHRLMRAFGIAAVWDDHEVRNDWDGELTAAEPERVATAKDVWREFFPVDGAPKGEIYRRFQWGPNLDFFLLDLRGHRDANSAPNDERKTMLGDEQRAWLLAGLRDSTAAFKLVVTTVPFYFGTTGRDHWSGFAHERALLFDTILEARITGVVFLTGDQHWLAVQHLPNGMKAWQSGALAQVPRAPMEPVPPWVVLQHKALSFGLVDYEPGPPPKLTFTGVGNEQEGREDTGDPKVLYSESLLAGAGRIEVRPPVVPADWLLTGAHVFTGFGAADLPLAPPGEYQASWSPLVPGMSVPGAESGLLRAGGTLKLGPGSASEQPPSSGPVARFHETFDGSGQPSAGWRQVDQCGQGGKWRLRDGALRETGNCYDKDGKGKWVPLERLGTFLANDEARVGVGDTVAVRIFADDNDGFGLMYGVSGDSYYRVALDRSANLLRLVRVEGGAFTLLGEVAGYQVPIGQWLRLAVQRDGAVHRVWIDGEVVLEGSDDALADGGVALYSWGMNDVRFDDLVIAGLPER